MSVVVDTPVWSFAYRRARRSILEQRAVDELGELIRQHQALLIGPVRQEVLSGVPDTSQFIKLRATLRAFTDVVMTTSDHELAAELHNLCRRKGVQGSPTDFLICAVARRHDAAIFTTDRDFKRYAKFTGDRLHRLHS